MGNKQEYTEAEILKAQKLLQRTGSGINANGKFTIGMTTALCSFQLKQGIPATGELDDATWKALEKAAKNQNRSDLSGFSKFLIIFGLVVAVALIGVLVWKFVL